MLPRCSRGPSAGRLGGEGTCVPHGAKVLSQKVFCAKRPHVHPHVHPTPTRAPTPTHTCTRSAQPSAEGDLRVRKRYGPSGTQPWLRPAPGQAQVPLRWPQAVWSVPWSWAAGSWPGTGSSAKPLLSDCPLPACSMRPGAGGRGGHGDMGWHRAPPWAGSPAAPQEGGKPLQLTSSDPDGGVEGPDGFLTGITILLLLLLLAGAQHLQAECGRAG